MNLETILDQQGVAIVEASLFSLEQARVDSYEKDSDSENRARLQKLLDLLKDGIKEKSLQKMSAYSKQIATDRFHLGFHLQEVLTAYNVLEQEIWKRINEHSAPNKVGKELGLVSSFLGFGKQTLAVSYVSLATENKAEALTLSGIFEGV